MRLSFLQSSSKKHLHNFILAVLFASILFLSSCSPGSQEPIQYYTGYNGVDLEIEAFSDVVPRGSEFPLKVTLTNKGAYDSDVVVQVFYPFPYISYVTSKTFKPPESGQENYIYLTKKDFEGKNREHPSESKDVDLIRFKANLLDMQSQKTVSLSFDYCYTYSTYVNTQLCINPDYNLNAVEPICEIKPITFSGGQGSIIAVSRIEPTEILDGEKVNVTLRVYLTNHGSGEIASFAPSEDISKLKESCFNSKDSKDSKDFFKKAKIRIKNLTVGSEEIDDLRNKVINLDDDNSFEIKFPADKYDNSPYVTNLNLEFDFVYIDSESVMVTIQ